jgi:hypothetical protein
LLVLALLGAVVAPAMAIEKPRYDVVRSEDGIEIRRYAPYLVAETFVDAAFADAGNEGFRRLFRYISGANTTRTEISMTAPVSQQPAGTRIAMTAPVAQSASDGGHWVSFVVPSGFTAQTVPQPLDPSVRIRAVPAQLVAVLRYAGTWREARYQKEERRLREQIGVLGLTPAGEAQFARYNPPYMPPFLRRNEILIPLAGDAVAPAAAGVPARLVPMAAN